MVFAGVDLGFAIADLVAAIADFRLCTGLGICVTAPSVSQIVIKVLGIAKNVLQLAQQTVNLAQYITTKNGNLGITFSSNSGDYAEWLPKAASSIILSPGQIIGVRKGLISLNTNGAERVLVISTSPIILGNNPEAGKESQFEKVAFLGQVPVRVLGKVQSGDYILAGGKNDGLGIAKNAEALSIDDIQNIVGIAWSGSDIEGEKAIKVAVGLTANDLQNIVRKLEKKVNMQVADVNELKKQINANNELLAKLIPGFKAPALSIDAVTPAELVKIAGNTPVQVNTNSQITSSTGISFKKGNTNTAKVNEVTNEIIKYVASKIDKPELERYPEMNDELIGKIIEWGSVLAKENSKEFAPNANTDVLLQKINNDPEFKSFLYSKIRETYQQRVTEQKQMIQQRK